MKTICLIAERYHESGVLTFASYEPIESVADALRRGEREGVHGFVGRHYTIYVIIPMVEVTREYALYIATSWSATQWERIIDLKLMNDRVPESTTQFLRERAERTNKLRARKEHHHNSDSGSNSSHGR